MEEALAELKPAATVSAHHVSWQDTMNRVCCESLSILGGWSIEPSFFCWFFFVLFQHSLSHKDIAVYKNRNVVEPLLWWEKKRRWGLTRFLISVFILCCYGS